MIYNGLLPNFSKDFYQYPLYCYEQYNKITQRKSLSIITKTFPRDSLKEAFFVLMKGILRGSWNESTLDYQF